MPVGKTRRRTGFYLKIRESEHREAESKLPPSEQARGKPAGPWNPAGPDPMGSAHGQSLGAAAGQGAVRTAQP